MSIVAAAPDSDRLLSRRISSVGRWIADCIEVMADHYAAAVSYEELSRLPDAELRRRGLSRATLARDVLAACGEPSGRCVRAAHRPACRALAVHWR